MVKESINLKNELYNVCMSRGAYRGYHVTEKVQFAPVLYFSTCVFYLSSLSVKRYKRKQMRDETIGKDELI